ncbi:hypothetical protein HYU17_01090 [Candidatus Woesearchaeota archaeon]|nr:hypothetical protein [Candidatus Woesearchaeota archaeon]
MPDNALLNTVVGITSVALGIIALVNIEFRVSFAFAAAILILGIVVYQLFGDMDNLKKDQRKVLERTDIYKELVDIKADIKNLKREKA